MKGLLLAELAILHHFESVGIVSLVLGGVIVSLLAFSAAEDYGYSCIVCHLISSVLSAGPGGLSHIKFAVAL